MFFLLNKIIAILKIRIRLHYSFVQILNTNKHFIKICIHFAKIIAIYDNKKPVLFKKVWFDQNLNGHESRIKITRVIISFFIHGVFGIIFVHEKRWIYNLEKIRSFLDDRYLL